MCKIKHSGRSPNSLAVQQTALTCIFRSPSEITAGHTEQDRLSENSQSSDNMVTFSGVDLLLLVERQMDW